MSGVGHELPNRGERIVTLVIFGAVLAFHAWGVLVGWPNRRLPGNEFRQTQTAITALFIQREHDFSLAYPTPVLGKPWSVPFEFPLYQWMVVWVSDATGLSLTHAGRAVSIACFYLALPAVWLLLGRLGVAGTRRLVVLGAVLTCPLYVFYARAFLIETMALMFSLWFLYAFVTAVERRNWAWLLAANVAGAGAGLVKVTTFMLYLLPAGVWSLAWLWRSRPRAAEAGWRALGRTAGWVAAATVVPFAATYGWIRFTDAVKVLNPASRDLTSAATAAYNFGTWETRFAAGIWKAHLQILLTNLSSVTVLMLAGVLALLFARRWRSWIGWCLGLFLAVQTLFPILYAWHEYYYVANAVLLMVAIGLVLCGVLESATPRGVAWIIVLALYGGQAAQYLTFFYPLQRHTYGGDTDLTEALRVVTQPGDVLVIAGEDWGSMTPYYSQRRALMIRRDREHDWPFLEEVFGQLKGEAVTALVLDGAQRDNKGLRDMATRYFDIDPKPLCTWQNVTVHVRRNLRPVATDYLLQRRFLDLQLVDKLDAGDSPLMRREVLVSDLLPAQREVFRAMNPQPARYYTTFGLNLSQVAGVSFFNAHPDSRLWFEVPPGKHAISAEYYMFPGSYEGIGRNEATDGAEFAVYELKADGTKEQVFDRLLNPRDNLADRDVQRLALTVEIAPGSELMFETGPGTRHDYNRDWAAWGPITIK